MKTQVLVVDDDPTVLQLVCTVLEMESYECLPASNAEEALAILAAHKDITVAISDIAMPGMSGLELFEQVKKRMHPHPPPKMLFLTAHPELNYAVSALKLGASDFMIKPIRAQELIAAVSTCAEQALREREQLHLSYRLIALAEEASALAASLGLWAAGSQNQPLHQQRATNSSVPAEKTPGDGSESGKFLLLGMEQIRKLRRLYTPLNELDDVAWDLLLELMRCEAAGQRLSVSALSISVENASSSTALRRIQELVRAGYITRQPDPTDARRSFVALTVQTRAILQQYLERAEQELAAAVVSMRS